MEEKSSKKARQEALKAIRKREKRNKTITNSIIAVALIGLVGFLIFNRFQAVGTLVEPMESADHVSDGTEIEYSTNPPTSGMHYTNPMPAGFYAEDSPEATQLQNPGSYIVHSLEHGYVVIWYNCEGLDDSACLNLIEDIRGVLEEYPNKVIAFPWHDMEENVVMTAWSIEHRFASGFDPDLAAEFIKANRSNPRAPEPFVE